MEKTRIMIVEDESKLIMLMEEVLSDVGYYICKSVTSGEEAIKSVEQEKPDIILMDIDLNGKMDGIEAAREIRSRFSIPIIFLTGHKDKETKERAKFVEPSGYFIKPVEFEDLKLKIDNILLSIKKR
ncbi:MAG: response regulator [Candidatus Scalindua sp. AMX11]|nr:MAG: response regulator [Candidatus Scalindua sp.]NOG83386.1 response regulator [Planctomycetota bacterium]RZV65547.1 MAG: response regulator [Candidatus Scalindua sp. SCAELEC01]TDE63534.1 MAG: response regulator [Candidatus Scalindua sp. AMX11]GJQ60591.1 MAG: response regulator [Candidatus Scalindua sp.]